MNKSELKHVEQTIEIMTANGFDEHAEDLQSFVDMYKNGERPMDKYYSQELADDIYNTKYGTSCQYEAYIEKQEHGEYLLTISEVDGNGWDYPVGEYDFYTTQEEAEEDVMQMETAGYDIVTDRKHYR